MATRGWPKRLGIALAYIVGIPGIYLGAVAASHAAGLRYGVEWVMGILAYPAAVMLIALGVATHALVEWIRDGN